MPTPTTPEPIPLPDSTTKSAYLRIVVGVLLLAGTIYLARSAGAYVPQFAEWVEGLGALGPIVFILGYAVAVVAFIPGSVMTLASGAIFGLAEGTLYVFVAATLGSTLAFLIARHAARASIEKRIEGDARFAAIDRAVGVEGRKIVVLLRLSPVFPFNLLNYALGLTRVRLVDYLIASFGMLPGTLLYVYSGMLIGDVAAAAAGVETERGAAGWWVLGVGFVATVAVTVYVTRIAKRALDAATSNQVQDPTE